MDAFLKEHAAALKKYSARNLDTALRSRHMLQFPMSTFTRLFLEKFEKQLATEQVEALSRWQEYWDFMLRLAHGRTVENCGDW